MLFSYFFFFAFFFFSDSVEHTVAYGQKPQPDVSKKSPSFIIEKEVY